MDRIDDLVVEMTTIEQLSATQLASFTACAEAVRAESFADDAPFTQAWVLARYSSQQRTFPKHVLLGSHDDSIVGIGYLEFDRTGRNDDAVHVNLQVHPEHRRRGIATALVARAVGAAKEDQRTKLNAWGQRTGPMIEFWQAMGAAESFRSQMSRLRLAAVDEQLISDWIAAAQPARDGGYRLHGWQGNCPDELLERYAVALCGMGDAPHEDLDLAPEAHTPATIREHEKRWLDVGSEPWAMLITAPDGSAAAMTEVIVHGNRPSELQQESTATIGPHRRRGLGRWIKAAMMRRVLDANLGADYISTGNADSNDAMLAINRQMGFRYHSSFAGLQVDVDDVRI